jgi:methionine sulfoxide reductase heme-binding subunit
MKDLKFNKVLLSVNALVPLAFLLFDALSGRLGANPIEFFLRSTGVLTLTFLIITLAVTPARRLLGRNDLVKYRRMLGLYAFFYACLHLVTYSIFDKTLDIAAIAADVIKRPFIALGMLAFFLLVPLAVTSTNGWVKRLGGKRWSKLHKVSYLIAILGVVHFWMIVKSDVFYPAIFGLVLSVLLGWRVWNRVNTAKPVSGFRNTEVTEKP